MLEERLEQDIKAALLARDERRVSTLRGLKSTILYSKVAQGSRGATMGDKDVVALFQKEAKKRQESADLYTQGGAQDRAAAELAEKAIIEEYLPAQMSEADLIAVVDAVIAETKAAGQAAMGMVIGQVKQRTAGAADGAVIARLVKERLVQA